MSSHEQPGADLAASDPLDRDPQDLDSTLADLQVDINKIEDGHHEVEVALPSTWIAGILVETDAEVPDGGIVRLEIDVQADATVLVRGHLSAAYVVPCARCLDPATVDAGAEAGEMCVTYIPAERLRRWTELSRDALEGVGDEIEPLDASQLDELAYEGHTLDLNALVREQLLLAYPMRALCVRRQACLGLCSGCGETLNPPDSGSEAEVSMPATCPNCGRRLDGETESEPAEDTPWKRALGKLDTDAILGSSKKSQKTKKSGPQSGN